MKGDVYIYTFCTWAGIKLFAFTLRFYLTPAKKVIIRNIKDKRCWHMGKGDPSYPVGGSTATLVVDMEISQSTGNRINI